MNTPGYVVHERRHAIWFPNGTNVFPEPGLYYLARGQRTRNIFNATLFEQRDEAQAKADLEWGTQAVVVDVELVATVLHP